MPLSGAEESDSGAHRPLIGFSRRGLPFHWIRLMLVFVSATGPLSPLVSVCNPHCCVRFLLPPRGVRRGIEKVDSFYYLQHNIISRLISGTSLKNVLFKGMELWMQRLNLSSGYGGPEVPIKGLSIQKHIDNN